MFRLTDTVRSTTALVHCEYEISYQLWLVCMACHNDKLTASHFIKSWKDLIL